MNLRGVYDNGMTSCFNLLLSLGIWNILHIGKAEDELVTMNAKSMGKE